MLDIQIIRLKSSKAKPKHCCHSGRRFPEDYDDANECAEIRNLIISAHRFALENSNMFL
jgi:hypothetical protein